MLLLPWVEKYRPKQLKDVVSNTDVLQTLQALCSTPNPPHILLHGPPGTGKTSIANAIASQMYGESKFFRVLELNASDDRTVETVRVTIKQFAQSRLFMSSNQKKCVILDEVDGLTKQAQLTFRRIMEDYASTTQFWLLANHIHKLIDPIKSRCMTFRMGPLDSQSMLTLLQSVVAKEQLTTPNEILQAIIDISNGDMRVCFNTLQTLDHQRASVETIYNHAGKPTFQLTKHVYKVLTTMVYNEAFEELSRIRNDVDLMECVRALSLYVIDQVPETDLPRIMSELADVEYRMSMDCVWQLQLGGLLCVFRCQ